MKSLKDFKALTAALEQMAVGNKFNDHENGTTGLEVEAYVYDVEKPTNMDILKLKAEIVRDELAKVKPAPEVTAAKKLKLAQMTEANNDDMVLVFKLLEPIDSITGTMEYKFGEEVRNFTMQNVDTIYCRERIRQMDLLEYEMTNKKRKNRQGTEVPVIKLVFANCIVEPEPARYNGFGKVTREARATVQVLSKKTMQVAGRMSAYARNANLKNLGVFSAEEMGI